MYQTETIKSLVYEGETYEVDGYYDEDTAEDEFEFYDIFSPNGECVNEGNPLNECPTEEEMKVLIERWLSNT